MRKCVNKCGTTLPAMGPAVFCLFLLRASPVALQGIRLLAARGVVLQACLSLCHNTSPTHTHISMNEMLGFFGVVPITVHITTHIVLYTHVDACIHVVQLINVCPQRACSTLADRALGCQEAAASAAAMPASLQPCLQACDHNMRSWGPGQSAFQCTV